MPGIRSARQVARRADIRRDAKFPRASSADSSVRKACEAFQTSRRACSLVIKSQYPFMPEYSVVPADLVKDKQVILDLWRQNLADTVHLEDKYDWHFLKNPFGPGRSWILESNGRPIGTT